MSSIARPITDDDLHAYIDEQLDPTRMGEVAAHLRASTEDAAKVSAYRDQRDMLRAAFADIAAEPIPAYLNPHAIRQDIVSRRNMWRMAAAIVLAFGIGGGGGWSMHAQLAPQPRTITLLAEEAVANHVVYTADKRRPTELGAEQRDDLARWVSNRIQHQVAPPDLALAGYRYMGGRLAATDSGPAGMFMYQNDAGLRLTVFVRPVADKTNRPQEIVGVGAMEGCAWIDRGIGYTVVAALPSAELKRVATEIAGRTPAG